ncbi:hypothetical protein EV580_1309 [Mycobacterium sp. BK086]|uniref:hypothetical protein n=1 Tax=Mycobacterium sp. BK086 TaxID=2512165 RepID=UPI00105B730A|nr:hypothetical protein [Mycobacterium sp. BK086]TDO18127.1 hypothetical protein EV580_1309 [Mycobacterium sp. BK086]
MSKNLRPYQWQLGDVVFGEHTKYPVVGVKIGTYNVNNQDFMVPLSSTVTMGQDTQQAGPITFTMGVFDNAPVGYIPNSLPDDLVIKSSKLLTALQTEWKADEVRLQYGALKPLIYCDGYGSVRRIYGRPRKFEYTRKRPGSHFHRVNAEFARIDTLTYTDAEFAAEVYNGKDPVCFTRDGGDANSWYRVLLTGPQTNPLVIVGDDQIQLQTVIDEGVTVEVSSYPWQRRIVDTNSINRRRTLIGNSKYLDRLTMPPNTSIPISWVATGTGRNSECLVLWRDAYNTV